MFIRTREFMTLPEIESVIRLVGGEAGLDNEIRFVTVMEAPDFPEWVSGGELVLSTLYSIKDDQELQARLIEQLVGRRVAALGVKVDRFIDRIPPNMIAEADAHGLPLFAIQREAKFREIIRAVSGEIINRQSRVLSEVDENYEAILKDVLEGKDIFELVARLGQKIRASCTCFSASGEVIARWTELERTDGVEGGPAPDSAPSPAEAGSVEGDLPPAPGQAESVRKDLPSAPTPSSDAFYWSEGPFHYFACAGRKRVLGYLCVKKAPPLEDREFLLAKQTGFVIAIKLLEERLKAEAEQRLIASFMDDVLFKQVDHDGVIRDRAKLFGWNVKAKGDLAVIVCRLSSSGDQGGDPEESPLVQAFGRSLRRTFPNSLTAARGVELISFITLDRDSGAGPGRLRRAAASVLAAVEEGVDGRPGEDGQRKSGGTSLRIGIGSAVARPSELAFSYGQAQKALRVGRILSPAEAVYHYEDSGRGTDTRAPQYPALPFAKDPGPHRAPPAGPAGAFYVLGGGSFARAQGRTLNKVLRQPLDVFRTLTRCSED